jgi:hypothetical protein
MFHKICFSLNCFSKNLAFVLPFPVHTQNMAVKPKRQNK